MFFSFNDTATTEIYTLSLHDALPIFGLIVPRRGAPGRDELRTVVRTEDDVRVTDVRGAYDGAKDRKSTRLNSSHVKISYAVFCLKKKKQTSTSRSSRLNTNHTRSAPC